MLRKTSSTKNFATIESVDNREIEMAFETDLREFCKVNIREFLGKIGVEIPEIELSIKRLFIYI